MMNVALLAQWQQYAEEKQQEQGAKFWQEYFKLETEFYKRILESKPRRNTVEGYAKKYSVDLMSMMGFLDGINDSL
ncbi:MAG: SEC-C domain-containing protein, partial [Acutalibacter sp.]|nr:SEC-C domain-containing protein [Acutalibacter sp.]